MTVLLLLFTFLFFIGLDYLLHRSDQVEVKPERVAPLPPSLTPAFVDGFAVPEPMRYHPGHAWTYCERKGLYRVGADEFAAALVGRVDRIDLPRPGQWLRQGQETWHFVRDGARIPMVSPTEGEVVDVNEDVLRNPRLLREEPYARGWLLTVHVPDEKSTSRNLIPTALVKGWMRNAVERLYAAQPQLAGATAADGGRPVDGVLDVLPPEARQELAAEFFLTR